MFLVTLSCYKVFRGNSVLCFFFFFWQIKTPISILRPYTSIPWYKRCFKIQTFYYIQIERQKLLKLLFHPIEDKLKTVIDNAFCEFKFHSHVRGFMPIKIYFLSTSRSSCPEVFLRKLMPKCDFNKVALQLYWNHTLAWVFSCKSAAYFQNTFS